MAKVSKQRAYAEDLAYVHDVGFGGFAQQTAAGLLELFEAAGITSGRVIDYGSGSGIWPAALKRHGYEPIGIDYSPAMIRLARRKVPGVRFQRASLLDYKPPRCRAVTALGEVFCYRFDPNYRKQALIGVWRRIFDALEPGGLLVFDVAEVGLDRDREPTFREGDDWVCLMRFAYDERHDRLTRHITTFRRRGPSWRRADESHTLQLYDPQAVAEMLRAIGFRVRRVRQFGDVSLLPGRSGFVARKP